MPLEDRFDETLTFRRWDVKDFINNEEYYPVGQQHREVGGFTPITPLDGADPLLFDLVDNGDGTFSSSIDGPWRGPWGDFARIEKVSDEEWMGVAEFTYPGETNPHKVKLMIVPAVEPNDPYKLVLQKQRFIDTGHGN